MLVWCLERVRIPLAVALLNDLQVKAADIMNTYVSLSCREKFWAVLDPEF